MHECLKKIEHIWHSRATTQIVRKYECVAYSADRREAWLFHLGNPLAQDLDTPYFVSSRPAQAQDPAQAEAVTHLTPVCGYHDHHNNHDCKQCYFGCLSNFEQFLGLFSKLVAPIDPILFSLVLYFSSNVFWYPTQCMGLRQFWNWPFLGVLVFLVAHP